MPNHSYWHSRGFIPHYDKPGQLQSITFRLDDALPAHVVQHMQNRAALDDAYAQRTALEHYLDSGYGACHLRDPRVATLVQDAFFFFDGQRYRLLAWVIMPNHVHVVIQVFDGYPLSNVVHSWKSYTAHAVNVLLDRRGRFWAVDYFDRMVRDAAHFAHLVRYLHENPVKAGLVAHVEDWPYSSARAWHEREVAPKL